MYVYSPSRQHEVDRMKTDMHKPVRDRKTQVQLQYYTMYTAALHNPQWLYYFASNRVHEKNVKRSVFSAVLTRFTDWELQIKHGKLFRALCNKWFTVDGHVFHTSCGKLMWCWKSIRRLAESNGRILSHLLNRLQSVLNAAVHLVCRARKYDHVTHLLWDLHWLRVQERILFRLAVLAFCCRNHKAPSYLADELHWTDEAESRVGLHLPL